VLSPFSVGFKLLASQIFLRRLFVLLEIYQGILIFAYEQMLIIIINLNRDCTVYRDMILKCDGLKPLVNILLNTQN